MPEVLSQSQIDMLLNSMKNGISQDSLEEKKKRIKIIGYTIFTVLRNLQRINFGF